MNDCSCNLLSWVAGNDVLLLARLYEKVLDAGEVTDLPFDLSACDDIAVTATAYKTETLEWAISQDESNCLAVSIPHTMTVGEWAVEITCKRNGYHVRSFEFTFKVVETNCEAQTTFEVVDGCQSASVRVSLQIVPQALVRGQNSYEMWKELPGNEDKTLQEYIDEVLDLNGITSRMSELEVRVELAERGRKASEANREEAEMQREANSQAAVNAANNAAAGAERVNASLSGTTLTVTNRSGVSMSVDTKGEPGGDGVGVPSGGTDGQVLSKKSATDYDTEWVNPPAAGVNSVNGKTGDVKLGASDVGALPDDTVIPDAVTEQTVSGWGFTKNTGTYSKPSGGIPSTDLSSDVQTSLGKADTALQSFAETDPTVPSWAKQSNKPSYTAQEVGALPNNIKYGSTIDLSMDSTTYVLTLSLKDQDGTVLNTKTVDLPIESVVVNGRYDSANKKIVLTLQSGSTIDVPVGDLIAGLQTEITSVNMLDADLVDDTNSTHKFVTAQEKQTWNNKSDFSGSYNDLSDKPTIPTALSQLSEDATHRTVSDTEKTTWGNKQEPLVSGTNIKTINNESILGSGNISISGGGSSYTQTVVGGASIIQALSPNVFYSFGTVTSLTVTLDTPVSGVNNEYIFEFDSGSTATTLSIPASVVGIDTTAIEANKHYEISIKYDASNQNYYGLIQEW